MSGSVNNIFCTTDILGRSVYLDSNTWSKHIIDGHPEMEGQEDIVKYTVEKPDFIYESSTNPKRELFFAKQENSPFPKLYTKAVVEYNDNMGNVTTAFFCKEVQGVNPRGIKYVKPKI